MKTSPKTQAKRVKRKVGYDGGDDGEGASQAMKKLNISSNVEQRNDWNKGGSYNTEYL